MGKTDLLNIKNFKKWILPILILISYTVLFMLIALLKIQKAKNL